MRINYKTANNLLIEVSYDILRSTVYGFNSRDFYKGVGREDWILINSEILKR